MRVRPLEVGLQEQASNPLTARALRFHSARNIAFCHVEDRLPCGIMCKETSESRLVG
jgi:hypothetical protein